MELERVIIMIKFGIIGTAHITHRFIKGMQYVEEAQVSMIASRSFEKACAYVEKYPSIQPASSIEAMLEDETIDAVYIATPNHTHEYWIKEALNHGKHVLCEKPMLLHEKEVHECFALAKEKGLMLMEAMKPCFLPTTKKAKEWCSKIGKIRLIEAGYCHQDIQPFEQGWHSKLNQGGGAMYDIGVYPLAFVNYFASSPIRSIQHVHRWYKSGIDTMSCVLIEYEDGMLASIRCAIDMSDENQAIIHGEKGTITIKNFWKSDSALLTCDKEEVFIEDHHASEFQYQIQAFVHDILNKKIENDKMSEQVSALNAYVLDEIFWR